MPSFFDKIWAQLFAKQAQLPSSEPLVSEPLQRKDVERRAYFQWTQTYECTELCAKIWRAYQSKQQGEADDISVHLLAMPYANGFAISFDEPMTAHEFVHLFDWLKDRTCILPYRVVNADRQIFDRGTYIETKEKYYLKPAPTPAPPYNQRYGNILIECVYIDREPSYMKFVANVYSDRLYTEALPFSGLLAHLFGMEGS